MRVRAGFNSLGAPQEIDNLASVVIYDDFGAPILVVQRLVNGVILSYKATDQKFEQIITALGIGLNQGVRYDKVIKHGTSTSTTSRS